MSKRVDASGMEKVEQHTGYTDAEIVTNISSLFLRPTAYSQI